MSLSTLRPAPRTSLAFLTDDSLLLIFSYLTVPQLLSLSMASRRFHQLILKYPLPQYRTLLFGYSPEEKTDDDEPLNSHQANRIVRLYFSKQFHPFTDFCERSGLQPEIGYLEHRAFNPQRLHSSQLDTFPESLPDLFPCLASLTFSFFLTLDQLPVNRLLHGYLSSPWSTSLVSLHLFIEVTHVPTGETAPFLPLHHLSGLRHLFLEFNQESSTLLPDSMPILSQLTSFSLYRYKGANVNTLLGQLGPNLAFLSLLFVSCTVADFAHLLRDKPSYRETLKTLEINLVNEVGIFDVQIFSHVSQYLSSLQRLFIICSIKNDPLTVFTDLARLSHLREVSFIALSLVQLGQLCRLIELHPRPPTPRLSSIRVATFRLFNDAGRENYIEEPLIHQFIPILGYIFSSLEKVHLTLVHFSNQPGRYISTQSETLTRQMKVHFKKATVCFGEYWN